MISEDIFDKFWAGFEGKIFLINLINQFEAGVIEENDIRELFNGVDASHIKDIDEFWAHLTNRKLDSSDSFTLHFISKKRPDLSNSTKLIRIAPMAKILESIVVDSCKDFERIRRTFERQQDKLTTGELTAFEEEIFNRLEKARNKQDSFYDYGVHPWVNCTLATNIKFANSKENEPTFCTSASNAHREYAIFAQVPNSADAARDILGLVHYDNNPAYGIVALGAIAFDVGDLQGTPVVKRPSVADMVSPTRFKGVFGELDGETGSWGRAIDLSLLRTSRPHRGGREVVVEARKASKTSFTFLGYLRLPRNDLYDDVSLNDLFLKICTRERTLDELKHVICG